MSDIDSEGLGFLYKKFPDIRMTIVLILDTPQFVDALQPHKTENFDAKYLYKLLQPIGLQMYQRGHMSKGAKNAMKKLSKYVTGDPQSWKINNTEE